MTTVDEQFVWLLLANNPLKRPEVGYTAPVIVLVNLPLTVDVSTTIDFVKEVVA